MNYNIYSVETKFAAPLFLTLFLGFKLRVLAALLQVHHAFVDVEVPRVLAWLYGVFLLRSLALIRRCEKRLGEDIMQVGVVLRFVGVVQIVLNLADHAEQLLGLVL